jgi:hypothetical protein
MSTRHCISVVTSIVALGLMILAEVMNCHFSVVLLVGISSGSIIAVALRGYRAAWLGAALGGVAAIMFLLLYGVLWFVLPLPPYPEKDF